ncbi:MAG: hypothetical protein U0235_27060 [Polyangiaceae bacterium]
MALRWAAARLRWAAHRPAAHPRAAHRRRRTGRGRFPDPRPPALPWLPRNAGRRRRSGRSPAGGGAPTSGPSAQPYRSELRGRGHRCAQLRRRERRARHEQGAPLAGNYQEGQVLESNITIQPGKCYTFVAAGVGPQELEISLVPQAAIPGLPAMGSLGSAKGSGQKTVLGGGANCIKLALIPVAVPAKWVLRPPRAPASSPVRRS